MATTKQKQIKTLEWQAFDTTLPQRMREQAWEKARALGSDLAVGMTLQQAMMLREAAQRQARGLPPIPAKPKAIPGVPAVPKVRQKPLTEVQQKQIEILRKQLANTALPASMRHQAIINIQKLEGTTAKKQQGIDRLFREEAPDKAATLSPFITDTGEIDILAAVEAKVPDEYLQDYFVSPKAYQEFKKQLEPMLVDVFDPRTPMDIRQKAWEQAKADGEEWAIGMTLEQALKLRELAEEQTRRYEEDVKIMEPYIIGVNEDDMPLYDIWEAIDQNVEEAVITRLFGDKDIYRDVKADLANTIKLSTGERIDKEWYESQPPEDQKSINEIGLELWQERNMIEDPVTGLTYDKRIIIKDYGDRTLTGAYTGEISDIGWNKLHRDLVKYETWNILSQKGKITENDYSEFARIYGLEPGIRTTIQQVQLEYQQLPQSGKDALKRGGLPELEKWAQSEYTKYEISKRVLENYTDEEGKIRIDKFAGDALKGTAEPQAIKMILKGAGFSDKDIDNAIEIGKVRAAKEGYFEKDFGEKAVYNLEILGDIVIPGYWAAKHWDELDEAQKIQVVILEAITLIPYTDAAAAAARSSQAVTRASRSLAAASTVPKVFGQQLLFPYHVLKSPIKTTQYLANQAKGFVKPIVSKYAIPEAAITQAFHTIKLRAGTPEKAKIIMDDLMDQIKTGRLKEGKAVHVDAEAGLEYSLNPARIMKEFEEAAVAHTAPDVLPFVEGTRIKPKPTLAQKEQFLFVAPEIHGRFAERSAFGLGTKEVVVESALTRLLRDQLKIAMRTENKKNILQILEKLESELAKNKAELIARLEKEWMDAQRTGNTALMEAITDQIIALEYRAKPGSIIYTKTAPSAESIDKFYRGKEAELGFPSGFNVPKLKHRYTSRIGMKDIDIYSETPLKDRSLAKLKALGPYEKAKSLITPPLTIKRIGPGVADDIDPAKEMIKAAKEAERAGAYRYAAVLYEEASRIQLERAVALREFYQAVRASGDMAGAIRTAGATMRVSQPAPDRILIITPSGYRIDIPREIAEKEIGRRISRDERQKAIDRVTLGERIPVRPDEPRVPIMPEEPRIPRVPEPPEAPRIPEIPEEPRISRVPEIPEVPRVPRIPEPPEPPRPPRVPEPPEGPRVPRVPRIPKPPDIPKVIKLPEFDEVKVSRVTDIPLAPVAWRQGFGWWVWYPPYDENSLKWQKEAPLTAKIAEGMDSAYKTIQALGPNAPTGTRELDMGIMDVKITSPGVAGKPGAIEYTRDVKQKTTKKYTVKKKKNAQKRTKTMLGKGDKAVKGVRI